MKKQVNGAPALIQRALQAHQQGNLQEAAARYRQILATDGANPDALHLLGLVAYQTGNNADAIELIQRAVAARPGVAGFRLNLGNALRRTGRLTDAIAAYRSAVKLKPDYADAWANLGVAFREAGDQAGAKQALLEALSLKPDHVDALSNLGAVLMERGDLEAATEALRTALSLKPDSVEALLNLGAVRRERGDITGAVDLLRKAALHGRLLPSVYYNLGNALMMTGQVEPAIAAYREALSIKPDFVDAHSNLLFALNHSVPMSAGDLLAEHLRFDEMHTHAFTQAATPHQVAGSRPERLRVGYVSADLRRHPVGYFISPLLSHHDRTRFEIWCFHNSSRTDDLSAFLRQHCDRWVDCASDSDAKLAELVRHSGIHILVDLSGHTAGNRLLTFARKPAPLQITYLGYPNTTGLSAMDYRITDHVADPQEEGGRYNVEALWRLSGSYFCFRAPTEPAVIAPPPVLKNGFITFGYCGSFAKISPAASELWVRLLKKVPGSKLLVRSRSLVDHNVAKEMVNFFTGNGIDADRIIVSGPLAHADYLDGFREIDIMLDGLPFNLATNTFEAMWMGVPMVTLAGSTSPSCMGASILTALGLNELVARTPEQFLETCAGLAANEEHLMTLRQTLRDRMMSCELMQGDAFARKIEAAYDAMWEGKINKGVTH